MNTTSLNLLSNEGEPFSLNDITTTYCVVYFYPKDMTSGCSQQAQDFRDLHQDFVNSDCTVIGISPDSVVSHQKFIAKYDLPFTLLADTDKQACQDYGVWQEKSMYGKKYFGVVRSTFLLDKQRNVVKEWSKVKVKGHVAEVYAYLTSLS